MLLKFHRISWNSINFTFNKTIRKYIFFVFDWWLYVTWLNSPRNTTYLIDFNKITLIFEIPVSAEMGKGSNNGRAIRCYNDTTVYIIIK